MISSTCAFARVGRTDNTTFPSAVSSALTANPNHTPAPA